MDIIEARPIHLPRIAELKHAMFQAVGKGHLLAADFVPLVLADYQELYGSSKACHLLAVEGGQIRSMAGGFIKDDIPYRYFKQARYGFLGDVYTLPSSRGSGLAARLSGLVLDWLKHEGVGIRGSQADLSATWVSGHQRNGTRSFFRRSPRAFVTRMVRRQRMLPFEKSHNILIPCD